MFKKILIANRGEIALRIVHACRELGIQTVAVHSTVDQESLHVTYADEDICIGPAASVGSYLNVSSIIAAAEITGAEAIHPGYGFLAENAQFADVLSACGITWIGPSSDTIRNMGDKAQARQTAIEAGVPVLPGSDGAITDHVTALDRAKEVGFPVILKASAGGGGRGMRIVRGPEEFEGQFLTASEEAQRAFGNGAIYFEKYLSAPRHIEFQIFGDNYGNVIHLGERECSIQRRHQKLIEESPSAALTPELRQEMGDAAVRLAQEVNYVNAGTIEFLLDEDGRFYFMEMNTRIQVEHPVTEMVTGVDLVKLQLRVAAGEPLGISGNVKAQGHAIECRINAEDPRTFTPSPGPLKTFHLPGGPGIRVDTHAYQDYVISPHYDSLVAKLLAWGNDRNEAIARMDRALDCFVVEGIKTSIPLQREIMSDELFVRGEFTTHFMEGFNDRRSH